MNHSMDPRSSWLIRSSHNCMGIRHYLNYYMSRMSLDIGMVHISDAYLLGIRIWCRSWSSLVLSLVASYFRHSYGELYFFNRISNPIYAALVCIGIEALNQ